MGLENNFFNVSGKLSECSEGKKRRKWFCLRIPSLDKRNIQAEGCHSMKIHSLPESKVEKILKDPPTSGSIFPQEYIWLPQVT